MDEIMDEEDDDDDDNDDAPTVSIGGRSIPIDEVNDEIIKQMTPQEKDAYIQAYQDHYVHMYD